MVDEGGRVDGDIPGFGVDDDMVVCLGWDVVGGGLRDVYGGGGRVGVGDEGVGVADVEGVEERAVVDGDGGVAAVFRADGGVEFVFDRAGLEEVEGEHAGVWVWKEGG